MKTKQVFIILLPVLGILAGCQSSTESTESNGCPFAPGSSNFGAEGPSVGYCPTCFLEFSHRDELYSFKFNEMAWYSTGYSYIYQIDQLFRLSFTGPTEHSQLFNSLNVRTPVMHPDSLDEDLNYRILSGFQIQNYCEDVFYPPQVENIIDSYNEISRIELKEDNSDEEYTSEEYLISGNFETFIVVNGLREPIKGTYKLVLRLFKIKSD